MLLLSTDALLIGNLQDPFKSSEQGGRFDIIEDCVVGGGGGGIPLPLLLLRHLMDEGVVGGGGGGAPGSEYSVSPLLLSPHL